MLEGDVRLIAFQEDGHRATTCRSVLYFFHPRDDEAEGRLVVAELEAIRYDLGYQLYQAVEHTKFALSAQEANTFTLTGPPVDMAADVTQQGFKTWIHSYLEEMRICIENLLDRCQVASREVDSVFLTGGSSFVPAVRRLVEQKVAPDRIRDGGELTSVATGLA